MAIVVTVLDEAATIDELLASVAEQSRLPDEVVVVDGGSNDGTWERLSAWQERLPLRALREPGAGISRGRNLAIASTDCPLVAVTDAGVRLHAHWLERLLAELRDGVDVVSGFFLPAPTADAFEAAMGATVLPAPSDVDPARFLPSSRSLLVRRSAWERVGGYPEWLDYCEDLVFDLNLKRAGCCFGYAPEAIVWFRPRTSLGSFFRQYFLYARGDGKADLWRRRHAIRYLVYVTAMGLVARAAHRPLAWLALLLGAVLYTRRPYQRLLPLLAPLAPHHRPLALALVPLIRGVGDLAKMLGYPIGVAWRLRTAPAWTPR